MEYEEVVVEVFDEEYKIKCKPEEVSLLQRKVLNEILVDEK